GLQLDHRRRNRIIYDACTHAVPDKAQPSLLRLLHLARADTTLSHLHSEMLFYVPFLVSFIVILTLNIKSV
ncbi:unnamed protein product, partial [Musa banksii]